MPDVCLAIGFVLGVAGVFLIAGTGYACLVAGVTLMLAGGLEARRGTK